MRRSVLDLLRVICGTGDMLAANALGDSLNVLTPPDCQANDVARRAWSEKVCANKDEQESAVAKYFL